MNPAPITLFVYNRPWHTRQTVESLSRNFGAGDSDLIIYSDAPKSDIHAEKVREVREYVKGIRGFRSVRIVERETNLGLAKSVISGVSEVLGMRGRIIVLEDDMVTSPYFLSYMNEALERFADEESVVCIHGYMFPIERSLPEAFFLPGADCWGWATWSRGWACFNSDGKILLEELKHRKLVGAFDYNGAYPFTRMLEGQIRGENDSWAVRWYASAFLAGKLTLHPGRSLVHNIGNDNSGTHCGESENLDVKLSESPIDLSNINVEPWEEGRRVFEAFFRSLKSSWGHRLMRKIRSMLNS